MTDTAVVTAFLRNRGKVLLLCRSDAVGSYPGRWGAVAGHAKGAPEQSARQEIREETGLTLDQVTLVRAGQPFVVPDTDLGRRWRVHPFLFDCESRDIERNWETERAEWVSPPAMLARDTVPDLWGSYDRVRPTVETVEADCEHGSTYVSMRALEVLRDEGALATRREQTGTTVASPESEVSAAPPGQSVPGVARELLTARPSMTAVLNRIHRAMAAADGPADVEHTAQEGIERAARVDREAAANAASLLGDAVATLSRSGTVRQTLAAADPGRVLVAESRPGREGVDVAVDFAGDLLAEQAVTLTTDAAFAAELAIREIETLLLGADSVLADGRVVNKVGTRGAALAAANEAIDVFVVAASDKISPETAYDREERDRGALYEGDAALSVANPTFDVTPPAAIDAVVTEYGPLDDDETEAIAAEHRALREWDLG